MPRAILLLLLSLTLALAQSTTSTTLTTPTIVQSIPGSKYTYFGCWNETTSVSGAGGVRALDGGTSEVLQGQMTVPLCLAFCGGGSATQYKYAGLEFSRECWCAQHISGASARLDDGACDTACDGNGTTVCGGSLKLSVYQLGSSAAVRITYMTAVIALVGTILFHLL
ncbi:hypothetical protein CONLIGDRAFT_627135 [Coniochaeta ligniaria NRRL 30616]|uniref:WSC domain-containing protein n=1 Tax=Coniochaeta ligniaria NRRL 30616 TaxID=1408157 RepID=A0A1J7JNV1_9PEZI|nr:hypothetical protein CONLIGDRAFT_627135 [Coniochaeta ligniaria NRRL 30616]